MDAPADVTQLRLGHMTDRQTKTGYRTTTVTTRWALYTLGGVHRPASGSNDVHVLCGTCGRAVRVTVDAEPMARDRREKMLAQGRITGIVALTLIVLAFIVGANRRDGLAAFFFIVGLIALAAWPAMAKDAAAHHGVKVARDESADMRRTHSIIRPAR